MMIGEGKKSPARRVFKALQGMSQRDVLEEFERGKTPNATINVCFVVPTILKRDIPARPATPPSAPNPPGYTVPDTPEQEKRDRSERQSELGAGIMDNRKRVRILVTGDGDTGDQQGAAIGPEEEGTCCSDSGVENPAQHVNSASLEQEPPAQSEHTKHKPIARQKEGTSSRGGRKKKLPVRPPPAATRRSERTRSPSKRSRDGIEK